MSIRYDARSAKVHLAEGHATLATVAGRQGVALSIPPCHTGRVDLPVRTRSGGGFGDGWEGWLAVEGVGRGEC